MTKCINNTEKARESVFDTLNIKGVGYPFPFNLRHGFVTTNSRHGFVVHFHVIGVLITFIAKQANKLLITCLRARQWLRGEIRFTAIPKYHDVMVQNTTYNRHSIKEAKSILGRRIIIMLIQAWKLPPFRTCKEGNSQAWLLPLLCSYNNGNSQARNLGANNE